MVCNVYSIGKIDINNFKNATEKKFLTDETVLTDERKDHIIKGRGAVFLIISAVCFKV